MCKGCLLQPYCIRKRNPKNNVRKAVARNDFRTDNTSMKVGYARVSTTDQDMSLQIDALEGVGCEKIFCDQTSGSQGERTGLAEAMEYLRPGDTLIVWRLDRLGRSVGHLIELVNQLAKQDIGFQSLQEAIDTTTSGGLLVFHIFGALAEFERNLIRERTQAGLEAARKRGRLGGRPKSLGANKTELLYQLYDEKKHTIREICELLEIPRSTLYDYLNRRKQEQYH
jgi:DNA invertase Pin-like site-specific DNA recombinase